MSVEDEICRKRRKRESLGKIAKDMELSKTTVFRRVKENCPDAGIQPSTALTPSTPYVAADKGSAYVPSFKPVVSGGSTQPVPTHTFEFPRREAAPVHTPPTFITIPYAHPVQT